MECLNPILKRIDEEHNFKFYNLKHLLKSYRSINYAFNTDYVLLPCGRCPLCLNKKVNEWSLRLKHELAYYRNAMFVTFTYSNDYVPLVSGINREWFVSTFDRTRPRVYNQFTTIDKSHIQKYFKLLRYHYFKIFNKKCDIKYFVACEYGDKTDRAHWHAIILGLDYRNKQHCDLVKSIWKYSKDTRIGDASYASARYVAKYCNKVEKKYNERDLYLNAGRVPACKMSSLGLGKRYCMDNKDNIYHNLFITENKFKKSIPRQYLRWLSSVFSDIKDKVKALTLKRSKDLFDNTLKRFALTRKHIKSILKRVRSLEHFQIVQRNHFKREIDPYSLFNYPFLYYRYLENVLLVRSRDIIENEKRKKREKKLLTFFN